MVNLCVVLVNFVTSFSLKLPFPPLPLFISFLVSFVGFGGRADTTSPRTQTDVPFLYNKQK